MENSQVIAMNIKRITKNKGFAVGKMLEDCGLSKNALSSMQSGGYMPRLENICKIADYLDCSVDYLLGRTDCPNNYNSNKNTISDNGKIENNFPNLSANDNNVININSSETDNISKQFIDMFNTLSFDEKLDVMGYTSRLKKNKNKNIIN